MPFNSTIVPKQKICVVCGKPCFWFSKKRCSSCAKIQDTQKRMEDNKEQIQELDKWKEFVIGKIQMKPNCENCGEWIAPVHYKWCCAHLIPKRFFESVATNQDNYLVLGWQCGCHKSYDNAWSDAESMQVFPLAIERFKKFSHLIAKEELKHLPDSLLKEIE